MKKLILISFCSLFISDLKAGLHDYLYNLPVALVQGLHARYYGIKR